MDKEVSEVARKILNLVLSLVAVMAIMATALPSEADARGGNANAPAPRNITWE